MDKSLALIVIPLLLAGCAIDPAPVNEIARTHAALESVSRGSIAASYEVGLARDKVALAERWMAAGDQRPARWLVEQAQVDAELAAIRQATLRARAGGVR